MLTLRRAGHICSNWFGFALVCSNVSGPVAACSTWSRPAGLSLAVAVLAQLFSATVVATPATDVAAVAALSVVAAVLARNVPSHSSAGLSVALCAS